MQRLLQYNQGFGRYLYTKKIDMNDDKNELIIRQNRSLGDHWSMHEWVK